MKTLLLLFVIVTLSLSSKTLNGRVVAVLDGDTFILLDSLNIQHKIRLTGIDAPEKSQPYGTLSKTHLSSYIFDKKVRVIFDSKDKYGRILGLIYVDQLNINETMLATGYAWAYVRFLNKENSHYIKLEKTARDYKYGLWADPNPTPPWDFRNN